MKPQLINEAKRFQKLAGIKEEQGYYTTPTEDPKTAQLHLTTDEEGEGLTPEQIAAIKDIFSVSEGEENLNDDAKFKNLTAKIQKYASKGLLTAALVAALMSMASCSGSKGMTNCNFIQKKMSGYRE